MAMTLRLTEDELAILRKQAKREHRSMHEVARLAILARAGVSQREDRMLSIAARVAQRDADALSRLAQ